MHALIMKDVINGSHAIDHQMPQVSPPLLAVWSPTIPTEFTLSFSPSPSLSPPPAPTHTSSKSPSQTTLGIP